jgi:hypothetical protein
MILRVCAAVIECRSADATCMSPQILHGTGDDEASSLQIPRRRVVTSHHIGRQAPRKPSRARCATAPRDKGPAYVRMPACFARLPARLGRRQPDAGRWWRAPSVRVLAFPASSRTTGLMVAQAHCHAASPAAAVISVTAAREQRLRPYLSAHVKRLVPIHPCSVQVHVGTGRLSGFRV